MPGPQQCCLVAAAPVPLVGDGGCQVNGRLRQAATVIDVALDLGHELAGCLGTEVLGIGVACTRQMLARLACGDSPPRPEARTRIRVGSRHICSPKIPVTGPTRRSNMWMSACSLQGEGGGRCKTRGVNPPERSEGDPQAGGHCLRLLTQRIAAKARRGPLNQHTMPPCLTRCKGWSSPPARGLPGHAPSPRSG